MRKSLNLALLTFSTCAFAAPAVAQQGMRDLPAMCSSAMDGGPLIVTGISVVSVPANLRNAREIRAKIQYLAYDAMRKVGLAPNQGIGCQFTDPTLPWMDGNNPPDAMMHFQQRIVEVHGYRVVQVARLNSAPTNVTEPAPAKPNPAAPRTVVAVPTPAPTPKGPTPNQLKYQRELAEHRARLDEIERIKAASAAKHSADRAAAAAELARHQGEKAVADAAQRRYAADLAAHQALISQRETKQDRERKVDWREAVVVCNLNPSDGQSQFGNWRCDGPLQMTYAKLGGTGGLTPKELANLSDACGGKPESVRDLGTAGTSRIFGCSFGLHPKSTGGFPIDAAKKHGISFVSGRAIYRCPEYVSACRTQ